MRKGIQDFLLNAGDYSCYVLVIVKIAERYLTKHIDLIQSIEWGIEKGFIDYNYEVKKDKNNFFVERPDLFLSMLINEPVSVRVEGPDYTPKSNEIEVEFWKRPGYKGGHFKLPDWDSLFDSNTVKYGKIVSKRIFTIK